MAVNATKKMKPPALRHPACSHMRLDIPANGCFAQSRSNLKSQEEDYPGFPSLSVAVVIRFLLKRRGPTVARASRGVVTALTLDPRFSSYLPCYPTDHGTPARVEDPADRKRCTNEE